MLDLITAQLNRRVSRSVPDLLTAHCTRPDGRVALAFTWDLSWTDSLDGHRRVCFGIAQRKCSVRMDLNAGAIFAIIQPVPPLGFSNHLVYEGEL